MRQKRAKQIRRKCALAYLEGVPRTVYEPAAPGQPRKLNEHCQRYNERQLKRLYMALTRTG